MEKNMMDVIDAAEPKAMPETILETTEGRLRQC